MVRLKFMYIPCCKKKSTVKRALVFAPELDFCTNPHLVFAPKLGKNRGLGGNQWARTHTAKLTRNLAWVAYTTFRANFRAPTLTKKSNLHWMGGFTVPQRAFSGEKSARNAPNPYEMHVNMCEGNHTVKLAQVSGLNPWFLGGVELSGGCRCSNLSVAHQKWSAWTLD